MWLMSPYFFNSCFAKTKTKTSRTFCFMTSQSTITADLIRPVGFYFLRRDSFASGCTSVVSKVK